MYHRRSYATEEFAIPLSEGAMPLDALLGVSGEVAEFVDQYAVQTDDPDAASWEIRGWPTDRDPEHLVILVKTQPGPIGVTRRG